MRSVGKRAHDENGKHPVNEDDEEILRVPVKRRGFVIEEMFSSWPGLTRTSAGLTPSLSVVSAKRKLTPGR